jgi:hypothetical protein
MTDHANRDTLTADRADLVVAAAGAGPDQLVGDLPGVCRPPRWLKDRGTERSGELSRGPEGLLVDLAACGSRAVLISRSTPTGLRPGRRNLLERWPTMGRCTRLDHRATRVIEVNPQITQDPRRDGLVLADNSQQDVLSGDVVMLELPRLYLGSHNNLTGLFGQPLKHRTSIPVLTRPNRAFTTFKQPESSELAL